MRGVGNILHNSAQSMLHQLREGTKKDDYRNLQCFFFEMVQTEVKMSESVIQLTQTDFRVGIISNCPRHMS